MLFCLLIVLALPGLEPPLEPIGRVEAPANRELSGLVASRTHPGVFWVHGDSGCPATLYAVRRDGRLLGRFDLRVANVDWEDVAGDGAGHLYVAETGNNLRILPIRAIYQLDEPDPTRPPEGRLLVKTASYYRFRRGEAFDAESLFIDGGRAVVIAKREDGREAELFAVPLDPPAPLARPALPESLGRLPGFIEAASGADLSADGRRLAVCSNTATRVYDRSGDGPWRLIGEVRYAPDVIEAIGWDGPALLLAGEDGRLYRLAEADWRRPPRPGPARERGAAPQPGTRLPSAP